MLTNENLVHVLMYRGSQKRFKNRICYEGYLLEHHVIVEIQTCKCISPLFGTTLEQGGIFYRATPAMTRGLGFCDLIFTTAQVKWPLTTQKGY